jgi:hypothetical protein
MIIKLTIVKNRGCVANFFHSGRWACHNHFELITLWRRTIVKSTLGVFHSGQRASQWRGKCFPDINHTHG